VSRSSLSSLIEQKEKGISVSQGRVEFEIADLEIERLHCTNLYFSIISSFDHQFLGGIRRLHFKIITCLGGPDSHIFSHHVFGRYQTASFNHHVFGRYQTPS